MKHKDKLRLARRIVGKLTKGKGVFESSAWEARKDKIVDKVEFREQIAIQRRIIRNLQPELLPGEKNET